MVVSTSKSASIALAAIGLSLGVAGAARADVILPVTNLTFNQFSGTFTAPKTLFQNAAPTGWSIGSVAQNSNLIGVGNQGAETSFAGVYGVAPGTGFSNTVPAGTNFYQADGNPQYRARSYRPFRGCTPVRRTTFSSSRRPVNN